MLLLEHHEMQLTKTIQMIKIKTSPTNIELFNVIQNYHSSITIDHSRLDKICNNLKIIQEDSNKVKLKAKNDQFAFEVKGKEIEEAMIIIKSD